ncbi:hypothetical protein [Pseudonocardia sp. ICBG601]|uniref:hypothetical protein n=1 Tax=Pseudonocardia sp. ICBG601 TaxID=2846759 RepID=UPI0027E36617|nr:hypothetical protein [Pseudonocardia sp. ICBG601]
MASRAAGLRPAVEHDLSAVRQIGAAGSPLPPEGYRWVTEQFGPDVLLNVGSGGTDVCSGIVQGSPFQPVRSGEISGPCLGVDAAAFDDAGHPASASSASWSSGPPCRRCPVGFWGDDGSRYRDTYFATWPGCGGTATGSASPPTAPRSSPAAPTPPSTGAASGWGLPSSTASWRSCPRSRTRSSCTWRTRRRQRRAAAVRAAPPPAPPSTTPWPPASAPRCGASSPRATSRDRVEAVPVVPRNRTGKKLEVPVKRILLGAAVDDVASRDVLADPPRARRGSSASSPGRRRERAREPRRDRHRTGTGEGTAAAAGIGTSPSSGRG